MESLRSQMYAENGLDKPNYSPEELRPIYKDAFTLIHDEKNKVWFGTLGQYRITPVAATKEEIMAYIDEDSWPFRINVMTALSHFQVNNINKIENE